MKLQRFYIKEMHDRFGNIAMGQEFWLHDPEILHQLLKVFRAKVGYQLILFNDTEERLYKIEKIDGSNSAKLVLVSTLVRKLPSKEVYLLWALLKNDKNDWILQKATELGAHKFVPIITSRSEKQNINLERAQKIVKEASEQCGRGDIPEVREPINLHEALQEYADLPLIICEQNHENSQTDVNSLTKLGLLIGPEGGWTDEEKLEFKNRDLPHIALSDFTLRAETAAITAIVKTIS